MKTTRLMNLFIVLILISTSCEKESKSLSAESAKRFFEMYQAREEWSSFQSLYADDLVFEEVSYALKYNRQEFFNFYNWPDTSFRKHPDYAKSLVLEDLALTDSSAVGRGYFTPFYYQGTLMATDHQWRFTIWLYFDAAGKIKRHVDYIDYPATFLKSAAEGRLKRD